jgi:hypothetical protein
MKKKKGFGLRASGLGKKKRIVRAKAKRRKSPSAPRSRKPVARSPSRWTSFVSRHGVVLASANHAAVPSIASAVAGEPIVGSWWAHAKGRAIFAALSELDDSDDIRCFKLVDGKVTFVHRARWPALVRLARDGALPADRVASVVQEHMPTGEHRNIVTPFPDWVDDATARAADALTVETARELLGTWTRPRSR